MRFASLLDLPPVDARAVVVNLHTDLVTTRALLSAEACGGLPILLLNADPTPSSSAHFERLASDHPFDIVDIPSARHGVVLDELFAAVGDRALLLLDSDAEIRDPTLVPWMLRMLAVRDTFGAGWLEGPFWLDRDWQAPERAMLYMERPWMPCVTLDVGAVRSALAAGRHFGEEMVPNEAAALPWLSWKLASRFGPPYGPVSPTLKRLPTAVQRWVARRRLDFLAPTCFPYYGLRPKIACYDTGGRIYEHLRFREGMAFAGMDVRLSEGRVHHYGGITRNAVYGATALDRSEQEVAGEVEDHLRRLYGEEVLPGAPS